MNKLGLFRSEFLKTKRSAVRRMAMASPLCLAGLALIQGGYFSLNLFNWFYVIFLPATFALISAAAVNIDKGKHGLRAIRSLPIAQADIWMAKLCVVAGYAFCSCVLLSVAVIVVPVILHFLGISQMKLLSMDTLFIGLLVMFLTTLWQIPLSFLLANKLGMVLTTVVHLFLSFSGVLCALKPYWFFCPWAWVNRCMIAVIGVLPNGLPKGDHVYTGRYDLVLALGLSLAVTVILGFLSSLCLARTEAR